jgi:hypothetical protein
MNLKESHNWVIIRLTIISILLAVFAYLIDHYAWNKEMNPFYTMSMWSIVGMNTLSILVFFILSPKSDLQEDDYKNQLFIGKLSRNIYLFSLLMLLTGLLTFSSTAGRVSYLFFLLALVTMPVAHVLYGIWIRKIELAKTR